MKTLVVGCDASGKSTIARRICERYGDTPVESSRSAQAVEFKAKNERRYMSAAFIDEREAFYLQLEAQEQPRTTSLGGNVVTTNSTLVTRLSHAVMRACIGEPYLRDEEIIPLWLDDERRLGTPLPDAVILARAEPDVIRGRMLARQKSGMQGEDFWGFNSPFFLERYQQRWEGMVASLGSIGVPCLELDTSFTQPDDAGLLVHYDALRQLPLQD
ncbi:MAG TPA: hypothetical protein VLH86_02790 [Patescibacteria group bacterium]|nr:hypothetical protein [Patescibacteria group bacterium]